MMSRGHPSEPVNLDFIYFDAGGGHRSAATALRDRIAEMGLPWKIHLVNLQEVLDEIDIFRKLTGVRLQDLYSFGIRKQWTLGGTQVLKGLHATIRAFHGKQVRLLKKFWSSRSPSAVVSFVPNLNRALGESLRHALPGVPFVVVLTDFADYPPHFWIERQPQYVICGTERAVEQAHAAGVPQHRVLRSSGMLVHPRFYRVDSVDRASERRRLGLDVHRMTALLLFGGEGSPAILEVMRRLERSDLPIQVIAICGRAKSVAHRLRATRFRFPIVVEDFTREVPRYMQLADFFIGKPGPGAISEALVFGLPVIVDCNAWTLPQERYNAEWVAENGLGIVVPRFSRIVDAVRQMIKPSEFARYRRNAQAISNRAVFEIPEMLRDILADAPVGNGGHDRALVQRT